MADINWEYPGDAIPAFVTLLVMPMSYSIAYGLIAGIVTYAILNTVVWVVEVVSGGRIAPPAKELREPWTWRVVGGVLPGWLVRLAGGKRDFWRPHEHIEGGEPAGRGSERGGSEVAETEADEKTHAA